MMTSETRGRSRKHKLSCYRGDSQDITSDGTCSNRAANSWEESDDINSYFCHQLSTLSIPKGTEHPPRKKLKRRKNRKVKRTRVSRPTAHISESSDVTPTSPASSQAVVSVASDDTVQEAMSVGDDSSDSSLSLGHITDLGGTDADDELSCWEGPYFHCSSEDDMEITNSPGFNGKSKKRMVRIDTDLHSGTVPEIRGPQPPLKTLVRREKLKTRHKTQSTREQYHGGSSTSSPSMTGIEGAMKRRYIGMEYSIGDGAGPSSAMHIGD